MTAEREELYWHVPSPGEPIPVGDLPLSVYDGILEYEDITWEVRRLCLTRSVSHSVIRAENIHQWLISATQDNSPDALIG